MNFRKLHFQTWRYHAITKAANISTHKKLETILVGAMKVIISRTVADTRVLAKAMLKNIKEDIGLVIIDHKTIRQL